MSEWRRTELGSLIHVKHGFAFKGEYFTETGTDLVLTPGNFAIGGGLQVRPGKEKYYVGEFPSEFRLRPGDLLIVMTDLKQDAPILGSPALVPDEGSYLHNQRLGLVTIKDQGAVDRGFLYWLLAFDGTRAQLRATATGATVRHTAPERIYRVQVSLPDIVTQRRIAAVLDGISALIENNRRRIALLEQMAQRIYREWFVCFHYPGHDDDQLVDSPLGPIPAGWRSGDIDAVSSFVSRGITPRYAEDGASLVINQRCIRNGRIDFSHGRRQEKAIPSDKQLRFGDVLINSTGEGTLGRVAQIYTEVSGMTVDTHVTIARSDTDVNCDWYGLTLLEKQDEFAALAIGSTGQTELGRDAVKSSGVIIPPHNIQANFGSTVAPLRRVATVLGKSSLSLASIRDRLLPRLVTGAIDVSKLDLDALLDESAT